MKSKHVLSILAMACVAALALPVAAQTAAGTPEPNSSPIGHGTGESSPDAVGPGWNPQLFKSMDSNQDGRLSRDEYIKYHESDWKRMDAQSAGSLTPEQFQSGAQTREMSRSDGNAQPSKNPSRTDASSGAGTNR